MDKPADAFMREALTLARANIESGGRPFGAVLVREDRLIARAVNEVIQTGDPTAHAELLAIRRASQLLGSSDLGGCVVYASGHPCPMCLAAMHLCGIQSAFFAYSNDDGEPYGLSTAPIYAQMARAPQAQSLALRPLRPPGEHGLYDLWRQKHG